jgi:hypothetical protein
MIRIYLPYVYELAEQLEPLARLPDQAVSYGEVFVTLAIAESSLVSLSAGSLFSAYLRTSYALSQQLLANIRTHTSNPDMDRQVAPIWSVVSKEHLQSV